MDNNKVLKAIVVLITIIAVISLATCIGTFMNLSQIPIVTPEPTVQPTQTPTPTETVEPTITPEPTIEPTPIPTPTATPIPDDNFVDSDTIMGETGVMSAGGYDFTFDYIDYDKFYSVDNTQIWAIKLPNLGAQVMWNKTGGNNSFILMSKKTSEFEYLFMKFMQPNVETSIEFTAKDGNGQAVSYPLIINFAVAIGD